MGKAQRRPGKLAQICCAGLPLITYAFAEAPFDWVSDMFRGLRGDHAGHARASRTSCKAAIRPVTPTPSSPRRWPPDVGQHGAIFIPLHRGAAGVHVNKQFGSSTGRASGGHAAPCNRRGMLPMPFWEGDYTPRAAVLGRVAGGQGAGHFDVVDIKKAKPPSRQHVLLGNVPLPWLVTGKPQQVKDYCKELIDTFGDTGLILDGAPVDGVPPDRSRERGSDHGERHSEYACTPDRSPRARRIQPPHHFI